MTVHALHTITLVNPLHLGDQTIAEVAIRKPNAGELRGIKLLDLVQMDVNQTIKLLPRVTSPRLAPKLCETLDPVDLMAFAQEIATMFFPRDAIEAEEAALRGEVEDADYTPLEAAKE